MAGFVSGQAVHRSQRIASNIHDHSFSSTTHPVKGNDDQGGYPALPVRSR
jgi:hypothetical protein